MSGLRINWVEGRPSLSGGVKSNRLLAEAMARRGHRVTIAHLTPRLSYPPVWRVRSFAKRVRMEFEPHRFRHHLEACAVPTVQFPRRELDPAFVPDADVSIASWWRVWQDVSAWPAEKGLKLHLVRGHETFAGDPDVIADVYRIPGPKCVISGSLERIMRAYGHTDIVRVPNGLDWTQFDSPARGKQARPTVGILASTEPVKRTRDGLEAIRRVQRAMPDLRVIAFGQKPVPESWSLPDNFEFHLQPAQQLIPELYRSCDCWLTCSASEGFGMPGLEAAAGHCALVSTMCGGPEDYINESQNGHLVPVGDVGAMAGAIERILRAQEDAWRSMSAASYAIAREFDWDRSAEKLETALLDWMARAAEPVS